MAQFIFVYHGGAEPRSQEEGAKVMAAWGDWIKTNAVAMTNPGAPVGLSKTLSAKGLVDGGGANPVSGFTIVDTADEAAALEIARGCPILQSPGATIEIAPLMEM